MRGIIGRIVWVCAAGAGLASAGCELLDGGLPGTWSGHVELLQFASGSDALKVSIDAASTSAVTGKVLFGGGPLLPPATDPTVIYPPAGVTLFDSSTPDSIEGFEYTIEEGSFDGSELSFSVDALELWAGWCALQTPVPMPPFPMPAPQSAGFWCGQQNDATDAQSECPSLCSCTESACAPLPLTPMNSNSAAISFDLLRSGDQLQGSVLGLLGEEVRIATLTKQ
jgi:hypothetical protein